MIIVLIITSVLNTYESSISLFRTYPYADLAYVGGVSSISFIDRKTGFHSPSFLSGLDGSSFIASFWKDYTGNGYFSFFSFSYDIDERSGSNFTYYGYSSGSEEVYRLDGNLESIVFERDYMLSGSYGFRLFERLSVGVKVKYISSTFVEKYNSSTFTFDFDTFFNFFPYALRFSVENISGRMKYISESEKLPLFIGFEFSRIFDFNFFYLLSGFNFKRSIEYSSYSVANEVLLRKIPIKFGFSYQNNEVSRFFVGIGLFVGNIQFSSSFSFPKILNSNDLRFSFTYFFKNQDLGFYGKNEKSKVIKKTYPHKKPSQIQHKTQPKEEKPKKRELDIIVF